MSLKFTQESFDIRFITIYHLLSILIARHNYGKIFIDFLIGLFLSNFSF